MSEVLRRAAELDEVLWNFSRFNDNRRITLQDNPHFYLELPTSVDAYTRRIQNAPSPGHAVDIQLDDLCSSRSTESCIS
jgi:hypothetical protein